MRPVIASSEISGGNVLSFRAFPTRAYTLNFLLTFYGADAVDGQISYRVRKWEDVIYQTQPEPFSLPEAGSETHYNFSDSVDLIFPTQGQYHLDILFDGDLLHTLSFSVFDSGNRSALETEIIFFLKKKRGAQSVEQITRGVYNPKLVNKANFRELSGTVYFALLRMGEVVNVNAAQEDSLEAKLRSSRWKLK
jgi:hypothetical protein